MATNTIHESAIIQQFNQEGCCNRIAILDKAFDNHITRSWKTKDQCICEAMGYRLFNANDRTYTKPING